MEITVLKDKTDPRHGYPESEEVFYFWNEFLDLMYANKELPVRSVYLVGSRQSGKTHGALHFDLKVFLGCPHETICYIVRKKERQLSKMKAQIFKDLEDDYNFKVESGKNWRGVPNNELFFKKNKIFFDTLNDEKVSAEEGGAVGGATFKNAKYIVIFFEECNQLKRSLVDQYIDTIRGGKDTKYLYIYASNPWKSLHWYIKKCNQLLPEDEYALKTKGYQYDICVDEDKSLCLVVRNNVLINRYVPLPTINKLQAYRHYSLNSYRICFLGLSGMLENTLYGNSYQKAKPVDYDFVNNSLLGKLHVGIDWGEGKSRNASPTTIHIGRISPDFGLHVFDEYTYWNNGDGDREQGEHLGTREQFIRMGKWLVQQWNKFKEPITCFIDTGALIDFHQQLNDTLYYHFGITPRQINVLPADKNIPIQDRVLTTNVLLSKGLLRIDPVTCPMLHLSLQECTQIEAKETKEEQKFERDHSYSHWLNSGVEYILDSYQYTLSKGFSEIYETRQED